jgi:hypothetical protein
MSEDPSSSGTMTDAPDNAVDDASLQLSRRSLLMKTTALLGVALLPIVTGCGGDSTDTVPPSPAPPAPPPAAGDVRATVSFRSVEMAARVDSRYAGLSYEKSKLTVPMFTGDNAALIQLFRLLGPSVLRIGANQVDRSSWNGAVEARAATALPPHRCQRNAGLLPAVCDPRRNRSAVGGSLGFAVGRCESRRARDSSRAGPEPSEN